MNIENRQARLINEPQHRLINLCEKGAVAPDLQERIRTAQSGNRDEHRSRRLPSPEPAVSGSDAPERNGQGPRNCGIFSAKPSMRTGSLRGRGLNGGGSEFRTLSRRIPSEKVPANWA